MLLVVGIVVFVCFFVFVIFVLVVLFFSSLLFFKLQIQRHIMVWQHQLNPDANPFGQATIGSGLLGSCATCPRTGNSPGPERCHVPKSDG